VTLEGSDADGLDAAQLAAIAHDLRFLRRCTTPVRGEGGACAESWANVARALAALGLVLEDATGAPPASKPPSRRRTS
jgi:hypothetical protein